MLKKWAFLLFLCPVFSTLYAQTAKPVTLAQLEQRFSKGRDTLYIVNFWATWCAPCVAELPNFEKMNLELKGRPAKVLLVSMDFESQFKKAVIPFVKKRKLMTETLMASRKSDQDFINGIAKEWSGALPATLVVNAGKGTRKFYEKEFTYDELTALYQTYK